jgi:adenine/guanine phosphoribosyltransferase-like PRPP-binding protein
MKTISLTDCQRLNGNDEARCLEMVKLCGGYYKCPKDGEKRLGPLVAYFGKYRAHDNTEKQWVGEEYVNFAMAETHTPILDHFASMFAKKIGSDKTSSLSDLWHKSTCFCGAPEGGKALALLLARLWGRRYIYPEKIVTAVKTDTAREKSELRFDRHFPQPDDLVWIVEDVCNNFSTTTALIKLVESQGAKVAGILCFLNRSPVVGDIFTLGDCEQKLPVVSLVRKIIPEFKQDDPYVKADVEANNVVWKPKHAWPQLAAAMASAT